MEQKQQQSTANDNRLGKRQINFPQNRQPTCTIKSGCFSKLAWNLPKELSEEEDDNAVGQTRHDQGIVCIDPAE